ncbi:MAG: hypothetical protein HYU36_15820 [Planctomycetes bacterium]|nr:hypothetical protein [Planctomycetota bacterium]
MNGRPRLKILLGACGMAASLYLVHEVGARSFFIKKLEEFTPDGSTAAVRFPGQPLRIDPFVDVMSGERTLLFESTNDGSPNFLPMPLPGNPHDAACIGLQGSQNLLFEVDYDQTHTGQYFFAWADETGRYQERWTDCRMRIWPFPDGSSFQRMRDEFPYLPIAPEARGVFLGLCHNPTRDPSIVRQVRVYGGRMRRYALGRRACITPREMGSSRVYTLQFESLHDGVTRGPIAGSGVQVTIAPATKVFILKRDHSLMELQDGRKWVLGSFLPHQVGFMDEHGILHTLSFGAADLLEVNWIAAGRALTIDAYHYHFSERSLLVNRAEPTPFPEGGEGSGRRCHENLGVARWLPRAEMTLVYSEGGRFLMPLWQPQGRQATLILTEHADFQETESDLLLTYGNPEGKVTPGQGLAGNQIHYTKSLFACGADFPFVLRMPGGKKEISFKQVSYAGNREFGELIRRYRKEGLPIEFGAHTAGSWNPDAEETRYGLTQLSGLGIRIWIDHGANETMIMRSGWDSSRPKYYILPALREFGIEYAWADGDLYGQAEVYGDLSLIRDNAPSHLLYYVPALDTDAGDRWKLKLFSTMNVQWSASLFSTDSLETFVQNRSVSILHCYLAYNVIQFDLDEGGRRHMKLAGWYDQSLQNLARFRDQGRLHIDSLANWGDYVSAVRRVTLIPEREGFLLLNPQGTIRGMSFECISLPGLECPGEPILDGQRILNSKRVGDRLCFWTDIPSGEHRLSFSEPPRRDAP